MKSTNLKKEIRNNFRCHCFITSALPRFLQPQNKRDDQPGDNKRGLRCGHLKAERKDDRKDADKAQEMNDFVTGGKE